MGNILENLRTPEDIQKLSLNEQKQLAADIRERIISQVSSTGGHLASNLGVVELTIALLSVYDFRKDKIVFDVGHQS